MSDGKPSAPLDPLLTHLADIRRSLGITQAELAAELGIAQYTLSRWELGLRSPKVPDLTRWAAALGRTLWASVPAEPRRVLVAGDWHGNTDWALRIIKSLPELLPGEPSRVVLHCGDFGFWPSGEQYLRRLDQALEEAAAVLWFVDGNHEFHPELSKLPRTQDGLGQAGRRVFHLPRGHRWIWHRRTWLALGGAVSLDRAARTEGRDWWAAEEITQGQAAHASAAGQADVMLTHDCPSGLHHAFPPPPSWWNPEDLARSDAHRRRLRSVVDSVRPSHLIHGHLHLSYTRRLDTEWGTVTVTGLHRDGHLRNWAVLDVESMAWVT